MEGQFIKPRKALFAIIDDDVASFQKIYTATNTARNEAEILGKSFAKNDGFKARFGDPPQHELVKKDEELRDFLIDQFTLCLPKTKATSKYGAVDIEGTRVEIQTDFLLAQMDKGSLQALCKNESVLVFETVYKRMTNLKKNLRTMADNTIDSWKFEGAPPKKPKGKQPLTPAAMKAKNDERLSNLTVSFFPFHFHQ